MTQINLPTYEQQQAILEQIQIAEKNEFLNAQFRTATVTLPAIEELALTVDLIDKRGLITQIKATTSGSDITALGTCKIELDGNILVNTSGYASTLHENINLNGFYPFTKMQITGKSPNYKNYKTLVVVTYFIFE